MDSRLFISSLEEVRLHVNAINSLQGKLRQKILNSSFATINNNPIQTVKLQELSADAPTTFAFPSASLDSALESTNNYIAAGSIYKPTKNEQLIAAQEGFARVLSHKIATNLKGGDFGLRTEATCIKKGVNTSKQVSAKPRIIICFLAILFLLFISAFFYSIYFYFFFL